MANLSGRLGKLEQAQRQRDPSAIWREQLAESFTDDVYAPHREAILDAMVSKNPYYTFEAPYGDEQRRAQYVVTWWLRDQGAPPYVRVYVLDKDAWDAI